MKTRSMKFSELLPGQWFLFAGQKEQWRYCRQGIYGHMNQHDCWINGIVSNDAADLVEVELIERNASDESR